MGEWDHETGRVRVNFLRALDAAAEAVRNIDADENYHYHNSPRHEFDFFRNPDGESFPGRFRWGPYRAAEQREQIPWDKIKLAQSKLNKIRLQQQCRMEMQRRNGKNNASTAKKGQGGSGSQSSSAGQKQMDDDTDDDAILRLAPKKLTLDELAELFGESSDDYTSDEEEEAASGDKVASGNEDASGDKAASDNGDTSSGKAASGDKATSSTEDASGDKATSSTEDASGDEDESGSEDVSGDEDAIVEAKSI